jgi:hypothetical protein
VVDIQPTYVGEKAIYFLGVMNNVHHEYLKRPVMPRLVEVVDDAGEKETTHLCLDKCLDKLSPHSRQMIEQYYAANKRAKIDLRKRIAERLVSVSALEIAALRIRRKIAGMHRAVRLGEARPKGGRSLANSENSSPEFQGNLELALLPLERVGASVAGRAFVHR